MSYHYGLNPEEFEKHKNNFTARRLIELRLEIAAAIKLRSIYPNDTNINIAFDEAVRRVGPVNTGLMSEGVDIVKLFVLVPDEPAIDITQNVDFQTELSVGNVASQQL